MDKNHRDGERNGSSCRCVYIIIVTDKQIIYIFLHKAQLLVANKSQIFK